MLKTCKDCNRELDITEFYVHKRNKDGYLNKCKDCVRARVVLHRSNNIEKIKDYERKRYFSPERIIKRKKLSRIYNILKKAIRSGEVVKLYFCEECGSMGTEAHHSDYRKPKVVKWLCKSCHMKKHRF